MKLRLNAVALAAAALAIGQSAWAGEAEAKKWIDAEFQPSTLNKDQQMAEMKWFIEAAKKLQAKGVKEISVVSETVLISLTPFAFSFLAASMNHFISAIC